MCSSHTLLHGVSTDWVGVCVRHAVLLGNLRHQHASTWCQDGIGMRHTASNGVKPGSAATFRADIRGVKKRQNGVKTRQNGPGRSGRQKTLAACQRDSTFSAAETCLLARASHVCIVLLRRVWRKGACGSNTQCRTWIVARCLARVVLWSVRLLKVQQSVLVWTQSCL